MVHIAPVKRIVEVTGGAVNNLLRDISRFAHEKAERLRRSARLDSIHCPAKLRFFGLAVIGLARFIVGMRRAFVRRIGVLRGRTVNVRVTTRRVLARYIGILRGCPVNVGVAARLALRRSRV